MNLIYNRNLFILKCYHQQFKRNFVHLHSTFKMDKQIQIICKETQIFHRKDYYFKMFYCRWIKQPEYSLH